LGGKEMSPAEFDSILGTLETSASEIASPPPTLLMTAGEWNQVQQTMAIAGKTEEAMP
jgi:hypothetical protein